MPLQLLDAIDGNFAMQSTSWERDDLLTEQGVRAFFRGVNQCEYGLAR